VRELYEDEGEYLCPTCDHNKFIVIGDSSGTKYTGNELVLEDMSEVLDDIERHKVEEALDEWNEWVRQQQNRLIYEEHN
jgi:uncharacterized Zn finger protein (UPF0148 family)